METHDNILPVPRIRVLVVEDNLDDSDLLVRQLQKNNFSGCVKVIPEGGHAWSLLQDEVCGELLAIFLDLKLPSMGGIKLLRKIRSRSALTDVPVFVMTSSNSLKDLDDCTQLGVNGYMTKPVTYLAFAKAVADLFHSKAPTKLVRVE